MYFLAKARPDKRELLYTRIQYIVLKKLKSTTQRFTCKFDKFHLVRVWSRRKSRKNLTDEGKRAASRAKIKIEPVKNIRNEEEA